MCLFSTVGLFFLKFSKEGLFLFEPLQVQTQLFSNRWKVSSFLILLYQQLLVSSHPPSLRLQQNYGCMNQLECSGPNSRVGSVLLGSSRSYRRLDRGRDLKVGLQSAYLRRRKIIGEVYIMPALLSKLISHGGAVFSLCIVFSCVSSCNLSFC